MKTKIEATVIADNYDASQVMPVIVESLSFVETAERFPNATTNFDTALNVSMRKK